MSAPADAFTLAHWRRTVAELYADVRAARWSCPLSPPENRLPFAVNAGERMA